MKNSLQLPWSLKMPEIPRAFINHEKVKHVLCSTIEDFDYEEQQAIYFFCFMGLPTKAISKAVKLTETHVVSVIGLYAERLASKLCLFKKALPYNADDMLQVSEILLPYSH